MSQNLENYLLDKYATKNTYMSKYSGSVAITILTLLTFVVAFGYNHYQAQLKFLKKVGDVNARYHFAPGR